MNAEQLIQFWGACREQSGQWVHPCDTRMLQESGLMPVQSNEIRFDTVEFPYMEDSVQNKLQFGMPPSPFQGDIRNAKVFVLMLNPGFSWLDYVSLMNIPDFKHAAVRNLKQKEFDPEFPFYCLNPKYALHAGFSWWTKKFAPVARLLQEEPYQLSKQQAYSMIAKNVACLEILPYASRSFGAGDLIKNLPSSKIMYQFVHKNLKRRAKEGEISIYILRSAREWGFRYGDTSRKGISIVSSGQARSASLSIKSRPKKRDEKSFAERICLQIAAR